MKKILFLHGFYASGACVPALTLKEAFLGRVEVLTPDLPMHPKQALEFIHQLCDKEKPDLLVGNSCGSFYAQILSPIVGIPALLGNPHFEMSAFLQSRIGNHQYKSSRVDGNQDFVIDETLIQEFAKLQERQFNYCSPFYTDKVWGMFGENDDLAHFEPEFRKHYQKSLHFPGAHTPTAEEVKNYYVPAIEQMLDLFPKREGRYFRHFKGNNYRFLLSAFDSETQERMVVYQALYGEKNFWVRPEKMFFEKVNRDGKTYNRFTEIDKI